MTVGASVRKRIWSNDRVRIIHGKYKGEEGIVTKRKPANLELTHFVWVRLDSMMPWAIGRRFHVKDVQILEKSRAHAAEERREIKERIRLSKKETSE